MKKLSLLVTAGLLAPVSWSQTPERLNTIKLQEVQVLASENLPAAPAATAAPAQNDKMKLAEGTADLKFLKKVITACLGSKTEVFHPRISVSPAQYLKEGAIEVAVGNDPAYERTSKSLKFLLGASEGKLILNLRNRESTAQDNYADMKERFSAILRELAELDASDVQLKELAVWARDLRVMPSYGRGPISFDAYVEKGGGIITADEYKTLNLQTKRR